MVVQQKDLASSRLGPVADRIDVQQQDVEVEEDKLDLVEHMHPVEEDMMWVAADIPLQNQTSNLIVQNLDIQNPKHLKEVFNTGMSFLENVLGHIKCVCIILPNNLDTNLPGA